jgi:hypothetical protein
MENDYEKIARGINKPSFWKYTPGWLARPLINKVKKVTGVNNLRRKYLESNKRTQILEDRTDHIREAVVQRVHDLERSMNKAVATILTGRRSKFSRGDVVNALDSETCFSYVLSILNHSDKTFRHAPVQFYSAGGNIHSSDTFGKLCGFGDEVIEEIISHEWKNIQKYGHRHGHEINYGNFSLKFSPFEVPKSQGTYAVAVQAIPHKIKSRKRQSERILEKIGARATKAARKVLADFVTPKDAWIPGVAHG